MPLPAIGNPLLWISHLFNNKYEISVVQCTENHRGHGELPYVSLEPFAHRHLKFLISQYLQPLQIHRHLTLCLIHVSVFSFLFDNSDTVEILCHIQCKTSKTHPVMIQQSWSLLYSVRFFCWAFLIITVLFKVVFFSGLTTCLILQKMTVTDVMWSIKRI